jgi:periplasmic divalent cation tolerance protein
LSEDKLSLILVTASNEAEAEKIAVHLVENKLAACVNIIKEIKSIFYWENKLEKSNESLLLIKTKHYLIDEVKAVVLNLHSYTNPEIVALNADDVSAEYLKWVIKETKGKK